MSVSSDIDMCCVHVAGGKNSRSCYNRNKQWRRLGRKKKEETSKEHKLY